MNGNPLKEFQTKLTYFALGRRRGIRNPFVVVPVDPALEWKVTRELEEWAVSTDQPQIECVRLDQLFPRTRVFRTLGEISTDAFPDRAPEPSKLIEETLQENLPRELIDELLEEVPGVRGTPPLPALLLLRLGALYPFAHASQLLDELDRRGIRSAVGVPFPGEMVAGKLSFFGEKAAHYYPAHQISRQVGEAELQR